MFVRNVISNSNVVCRCISTVRNRVGLKELAEIHWRNTDIIRTKRDRDREDRTPKPNNSTTAVHNTLVAQSPPPLIKFNLSCPGCGAKYQHKDSDKPGYLEEGEMKTWDTISAVPCQRCVSISDLKDHRMYSCTEDRFRKLLKNIASRRSLTVIVCDIVGFPTTLPPFITDIFPRDIAPVILVLNKCDVIAEKPGAQNIVQKYYSGVVEAWERVNRFKFTEVMYVSARSGTGVPELSETIQSHLYGDMGLDKCYLIGVTNAGKSTLFNKLQPLLRRDMGCVGWVTESSHPGTTVTNISTNVSPPGEKLSGKVKRLQAILERSSTPEYSNSSDWFAQQINHQLDGTEGKALIDTPGVLPANTLPEATFTCQNSILRTDLTMTAGQVLSFGWYKIYYVRGNNNIRLALHSSRILTPQLISESSDKRVGMSDTGVKLANSDPQCQ
eukprot:sb/3464747/